LPGLCTPVGACIRENSTAWAWLRRSSGNRGGGGGAPRNEGRPISLEKVIRPTRSRRQASVELSTELAAQRSGSARAASSGPTALPSAKYFLLLLRLTRRSRRLIFGSLKKVST
jgi:hypothetical protein